MKSAAALALLLLVGCSDRSLIRNASAAYQYQKSIYQRECPLPPSPRSDACATRDAMLEWDYFQIDASIDAIERSKGGALPRKARAALKQIRKELDR